MTTEVGNQPIVNVVWYIQICHLIQKGSVADVVKSLTKVERYDNYIRVCDQKPRDRVQNKNQRSCCGAGESEVILIIISFPSPTYSFIPGLKPSFSANPSHRCLTFSSSGLNTWILPDLHCYF